MFKKSIYSAELASKNVNAMEIELEEELRIEDEIEPKIFGMAYKSLDFDSTAFLTNFKVVTIKDEENRTRTALMLIFCNAAGEYFTAYIKQDPYLLIKCTRGHEDELISFLEKKFDGKFSAAQVVDKVDLEQLNHLSGILSPYIKLSFSTLSSYAAVVKVLSSRVREQRRHAGGRQGGASSGYESAFAYIEDLREHDVMYSARVAIDHNIRVSFWYDVKVRKGFVHQITPNERLLEKPDFGILAFDIETMKAPMKFPQPSTDAIMMISYTTAEQSYLVVNREVVSRDIVDFTYVATSALSTHVTVYNEANEKEMLQRFISEIYRLKPLVLTTYNGDFFDVPYIMLRAQTNGIDITKELGLMEQRNGFFVGKHVFLHMDCLYWVKRDAFLPQGSQGLKSVTKAKLGYEPRDVDPEAMVGMARDDPQTLCEYSVSDSFATYTLYKKHIHDFIFALCTIVPMNADDVLRRGSGTLCEHLLMAQAYANNIVFPNKKMDEPEKFYKGHLLESETYVGGYVECVNNGVYRADIPTAFKLSPDKYESMIESVDAIVRFFVEVECAEAVDAVANFKDVREAITDALLGILGAVKDSPAGVIESQPLIYHVDVASMYPNIILTNRLQPTAIVNDQICSNCIFNEAKNKCKRNLGWDWKASYYPLNDIEYRKVKVDAGYKDVKAAVKAYCQKNYKCAHKNIVEYKEDTVCMRENSFYVDTIRDFRDRRYKYKGLAKTYGGRAAEAKAAGEPKKASEAAVLSVLYDSLQLAHKIILNSFYGYVMKKGARWYSMEMAAMVTFTGAKIIQEAAGMMEALGKPLELDTDGIWTLLPSGFPERFELALHTGKKLSLSFPCTMMNWAIHDRFKNPQYQTLVDPAKRTYAIKDEMSIFFEIDGPYKAMVIPAAREEGKKLKKRYCVFNFRGQISEIKGFEIKRRGELGIIKAFQHDIFGQFLAGTDMKSLYAACADVCRKWLSIITGRGGELEDARLIEMIGEVKVLSKGLSQYGKTKGVAITAARRMADFLGMEMVDGGSTNVSFVISRLPENTPVNERAIPLQVFSLEASERDALLKRWLKVPDASKETLKSIVDWEYYLERLSNTMQKIVLIPAILQGLDNPLPELAAPDWLAKKLTAGKTTKAQIKLTSFFSAQPKTFADIENLYAGGGGALKAQYSAAKKKVRMEIEEAQTKKNSAPPVAADDSRPLALVVLKEKWKRERARIKHQPIDKIQMTTTSDLQAFTKQLENRIKNAKWHVLKVSPSPEKGYLYLWIVIDGVFMLTKKVHAYRRIYVNSVEKDSRSAQKPCRKKLPREKTAFYLYEYAIAEHDFAYSFKNIEYYYTNAAIEGVYETHVPLDFRLLANATSHCAVDVAQYNPAHNYVEAAALLPDEKDEAPLLFGDAMATSRTKFVYVWGREVRNRQLVMLFTDAGIWVYKLQNIEESAKNKINLINRIKAAIKRDDAEPAGINFDALNINCGLYANPDALRQSIGNAVAHFKANLKFAPGLLVLDTNSSLVADVARGLETELPVLALSALNMDETAYSALDWTQTFALQGIRAYKKAEWLLQQYDAMSQYTRIPLCNFKSTLEESIIFAIDVVFARELNKAFYVWWYSKNATPDLGTNTLAQLPPDEFLQAISLDCELNCPVISQNYVFEIDILMFHFNALIVSESMVDMAREFISTHASEGAGRKVYDEEACDNKIGAKIVKDMFMRWYTAVLGEQNETANLLLQNLVRWMCSEKSAFFDPYIKKHLDAVVKRIFDDFIDKLKRLGAAIVFASPYKVLIQTNRKTYQAANNFVQFVLKSLIKDSAFAYIVMKIAKVYKNLVYYDINNYSGINVDFEYFADVDEVAEEHVNGKLSMTYKWALKEFMPRPVQKYFELILNTFITKFYEYQQEVASIDPDNDAAIMSHIVHKIEQYMAGDFSTQFLELISYICEQQRLCEISVYEKSVKKEASLRNSLYHDVGSEGKRKHEQEDEEASFENEEYEKDSFLDDDINDVGFTDNDFLAERKSKPHANVKLPTSVDAPERPKKHEKEAESWTFPQVIGSKVELDNVALEFTKTVFEVLGKDAGVFNQLMESTRPTFFKYINVCPYDSESTYRDMCLRIKILDVICDQCFMVRTLDLFNDFDRHEKCWSCFCGAKYAASIIENKVIKYIKGFVNFLMGQDAHCTRCKSAKSSQLPRYCSCGGPYARSKYAVLEEFIGEASRGFKNFKQLAFACDFRMLADLVDTIHI